MITCKEDLINTKVDGRNKELCKLFQELAFSFGFTWCDSNDQVVCYPDDGYFVICCDDEDVFWERVNSSIHQDYTQLTMSDLKHLKPKRTKVVYEKVNFSSVGECVQSVHDNYGEYFFFNNGTGEYQLAEYQDSAWYWKEDNIYIKVEKEIDWQTLVSEFVRENNCNDAQPGEAFDVDGLVLMDDDFLEMCRVALRATGELE